MQAGKSLSPEELYRRCDPESLAFETTAQLEDLTEMLGQDRAVEAVKVSAGMVQEGFNLFVLGPPGTGRHSFVRRFLEQKAAAEPVPSDWCYVNNFDDARTPTALEFPPGKGAEFREDILQLIEEAHQAIPAAFETEDYHKRRRAIEDQAEEEGTKVFQEIKEHAEERGLGIIKTSTGFAFVPLREGKSISPDEYEQMSDEEQERLRRDTEDMAAELQKMLQTIPKRVRKVREKTHELDRDVALFAVGGLINELVEKYRDLPEVVAHLKSMQGDIVDNIELFQAPHGEVRQSLKQLLSGLAAGQASESPTLRRYTVNLLVDHSAHDGAPVVFEDYPTYQDLVGRIEHRAQMGVLSTDFNLIKAGALHRANGGYLVLDAIKVLIQPFAWDALKRALKSRQIRIRSLGQVYGLVSTVSLEPEPIPMGLKVVLIGDRYLYYLLEALDPEFPELFKVAADFDDQMARSDENVQRLAQVLATVGRREELLPLDRCAVARLIDESARHAGDAEKLSARIRQVLDIAREANFWATEAGKDTIGVAEVERAVESRIRRTARIRDRLREEILRETLLIDTEGEKVGQINGLSIWQVGEFVFGRPSRITARISLGSGKVIDIEREVELGGPIHSKGVLILAGFLASHYVTDRPLSLFASLVFEQSYAGIEGDSASLAELCALLSALVNTPVRQGLAVTGSVNQHGQVQAIGAVNEKIEGFFDICQSRGLKGDQGVIIPAANVKHLMLRQEVVKAVADGQFHITPVETVDQCLQLLTGIEAGHRDEQGEFPKGSLNGRITDRLIELAEHRRAFARTQGEEGPKD